MGAVSSAIVLGVQAYKYFVSAQKLKRSKFDLVSPRSWDSVKAVECEVVLSCELF